MESKKYKNICIGIDQSYEDTGVTLNCDNGKHITCKSIKLSKLKNKTEKRKKIQKEVELAIQISLLNAEKVVIIVERIRQFSGRFISMDYIKSMASLISTIVDIAYCYDLKVFSVDTRNWKSNIVGTSKPMKNSYGIDPKKYPTILWCKSKGYEDYILKNEKYNDNIADSIAISFTPWNKQCFTKYKQET